MRIDIILAELDDLCIDALHRISTHSKDSSTWLQNYTSNSFTKTFHEARGSAFFGALERLTDEAGNAVPEAETETATSCFEAGFEAGDVFVGTDCRVAVKKRSVVETSC